MRNLFLQIDRKIEKLIISIDRLENTMEQILADQQKDKNRKVEVTVNVQA